MLVLFCRLCSDPGRRSPLACTWLVRIALRPIRHWVCRQPPSRDLHTVDDGVLDHLSNELAKEDWEVLVAHFLGVDHVGHTFGPASQAMEDKLDQMNQALR